MKHLREDCTAHHITFGGRCLNCGAVPEVVEKKFESREDYKNFCAKTRPVSDPYEVWVNDNGWTWKILKKYQKPELEAKNQYARWFCFVTSPFCPDGEMGDVYVHDIKNTARPL